MSQTVSEDRKAFAMWPVVLAGLAGAAMFNLAPLYLETNGSRFGLNDQQIGWLMSVEVAGIALASLLVLIWMRHVALRHVALIGLVVIVCGNLASLTVDSFVDFLLIRFATGLFGDGFAYVAAITCLGRHSNPVRAFATLSFTNMCVIVVAMVLIPKYSDEHRQFAVLATLILFGLIALALWRHFPRFTDTAEQDPQSASAHIDPLHLLALFGLMTFTANLGAVWGYVERIGVGIGMELATTAQLLSLSVVFQAMGSLSAILLSRKIMPGQALLLIAVFQACGILFLVTADNPWSFLAGVCLWGASWNFGAANFLGLLASAPNSRRALLLAPGIEALGAAGGPILVGGLLILGTQLAVSMVALGGSAISIAIYMWVSKSSVPPSDADATHPY